MEIFDGEITVYLYNLREAEESQLIERRLVATAKNTKLINVSSGDFTTYDPISADLEYIIFFIAESGNHKFEITDAPYTANLIPYLLKTTQNNKKWLKKIQN